MVLCKQELFDGRIIWINEDRIAAIIPDQKNPDMTLIIMDAEEYGVKGTVNEVIGHMYQYTPNVCGHGGTGMCMACIQ
jgi:uncharacterized protein YlzI (FlbEa/FlbD family)